MYDWGIAGLTGASGGYTALEGYDWNAFEGKGTPLEAIGNGTGPGMVEAGRGGGAGCWAG